MQQAKTSGTRALQKWKELQGVIYAKMQKLWAAEWHGSFDAKALKQTLDESEVTAAKSQNARHRNEYRSNFAFHRDSVYMGRSRKFLFAKAVQSKLDACYEEWSIYARLNNHKSQTAKLPDKDIVDLGKEEFKNLV